MQPQFLRANKRAFCDAGEVASWLILAAALAMTAGLIAGMLGDIYRSLASNIADAAHVDAGSPTGDGGPGAGSPTGDGGPGAGSPTGSDGPTGPGDGGPGAGSPTGSDGPTGPGDGGPGAGSPTGSDEPESDEWPDICTEFVFSACDADGNCVSFDAVACSASPAAREAYARHQWYEMCSVTVPPIWCRGYTRGLDAGFRTILESELGAHPGDLFLAAARLCDAGHPSCELWIRIAQFVHDNRAAIATTTVLGDIIPGPSGVGCVAAVADGSLTGGEVTECAIGLGTGLSVPIPAGVIDDALDG